LINSIEKSKNTQKNNGT